VGSSLLPEQASQKLRAVHKDGVISPSSASKFLLCCGAGAARLL